MISKSEKRSLVGMVMKQSSDKTGARQYYFATEVRKILSRKRKRRKTSKMLFIAYSKSESESMKYDKFEKELKKLVTPWMFYEYQCDFGGSEERCTGKAQANI